MTSPKSTARIYSERPCKDCDKPFVPINRPTLSCLGCLAQNAREKRSERKAARLAAGETIETHHPIGDRSERICIGCDRVFTPTDKYPRNFCADCVKNERKNKRQELAAQGIMDCDSCGEQFEIDKKCPCQTCLTCRDLVNKIKICVDCGDSFEVNPSNSRPICSSCAKILAKQLVDENRDTLNTKRRIWYNDKYNTDPIFKLRQNFSNQIKAVLKNKGISKNSSIFDMVPYTIKELYIHIEDLFEPWMNWHNHGCYILSEWNDNDPLTWRWQLDHIIPHSTFEYIAATDEAFQECWALKNLRPLSAKQNVIDGNRRSNSLLGNSI